MYSGKVADRRKLITSRIKGNGAGIDEADKELGTAGVESPCGYEDVVYIPHDGKPILP